MDLTKKEIFHANQLKILEKLDHGQPETYSEHRKALENNYALPGDWLFDFIYDESRVEQCIEVLDILDMYNAITISFKNLKDKSEIKNLDYLKFRGFDGNSETSYKDITNYVINTLDRYPELRPAEHVYGQYNSYSERLFLYRRMVKKWHLCENKSRLSLEDLRRILIRGAD